MMITTSDKRINRLREVEIIITISDKRIINIQETE
jgi:hypothetical protein